MVILFYFIYIKVKSTFLYFTILIHNVYFIFNDIDLNDFNKIYT